MTNPENSLAISSAGQRFLEAYAEPVVANNYLKVALLSLFVVSLVLVALLYRAQTAALHLKPLIISVDDLGSGRVLEYADFRGIPIERVSKYYLARWAELYYGRNHATLERDFSESLNFLANDLERATLARVKKTRTLQEFLLDPGQPNADIEVASVVLEDTRVMPGRARVEFQKVFRAAGDLEEQRREGWTVNVVYGFRDEVPNQMLRTNPLGLVISYVHEDQAFRN
jgi:type IV secretory pathway TrbF-like protein